MASDSASTSCEWDAPGLTDVALPRAIVGVVRGGNTTDESGRLAVTDWLDCVGGGGGHWVGAENNFAPTTGEGGPHRPREGAGMTSAVQVRTAGGQPREGVCGRVPDDA